MNSETEIIDTIMPHIPILFFFIDKLSVKYLQVLFEDFFIFENF